MAEKKFFDLLKEKMEELRPMENHRRQDWAALGSKLDLALPQQKQRRKERLMLPLVLLIALLSTNALWWSANQDKRLALEQLEAKLGALQSENTMVAGTTLKTNIRIDTIWQVRYVYVTKPTGIDSTHLALNATGFSRVNPLPTGTFSVPHSKNAFVSYEIVEDQSSTTANKLDTIRSTGKILSISMLRIANFGRLSLPIGGPFKPTPLQTELRSITIPEHLKPQRAEVAITKKITYSLRPRFCKLGGSAGWLNASSKQLMHEGGIAYNLQAEIGFSKRWSLIADFGVGKMHYKAHSPEAILGSPELPMPPSVGHHYTEMDVTGQRVRQFGLGLRYTFPQIGKFRPFLGASWGGQNLRPFSIHYEIQHEPSGILEKAVFEVTTAINIKNLLGIHAGFETPLTNRINFSIQGFYQRQWKKNNREAPDLNGVRAGINLGF